jgi:RND family efflux transporter MFP subunit
MSNPLAGLAVDRSATPPARRPHAARVLALGLGLAVILAVWLLRERLVPALPVTVAPVVALADPVAHAEPGSVLARASGWFHPDPLPVALSAQRAGSIATVHVRPGQVVAAGDLIAELDGRDAALAVRRAEAAIAAAEADRDRAAAEVAAAEARLAQARDRHERLRRADAAASADLLAQAAHEVAVRAAEKAVAATARGQSEAALQAAQVGRASAALEVERGRIVAPTAGVILRLAAVPGRHLSLDSAETALIAELFDPARVQVRADVPLADAGAVRPGQRVEIECELLSGRILAGSVVGIAGLADATRNTLAVHIALNDPPSSLRPDMLARVRILGDAAVGRTVPAVTGLAAPVAALRERSGDRAVAWAVDTEGRLRQRAIVLAGPDRGTWAPVAEGLVLGEPLVLGTVDGLHEGRRVQASFAEGP